MSEANDKAKNYIGVRDLRLACKQFAMLYFHVCKTLTETLGEDQAAALVKEIIFKLSLDRTERARERANSMGLETTLENFPLVNDLPLAGWSDWSPEMGGVRCPYAEIWLEYFKENPWFKRFASLYCDVIDTTNIENFTRTTSHKITKNLLWGDSCCEREYFESDTVKEGRYSYGKK